MSAALGGPHTPLPHPHKLGPISALKGELDFCLEVLKLTQPQRVNLIFSSMFFGTSALKGFVSGRTSYGYLSFSGLTAFFSGDIWDDFVFKVYRIHKILATLEKLRASLALKG